MISVSWHILTGIGSHDTTSINIVKIVGWLKKKIYIYIYTFKLQRNIMFFVSKNITKHD